MGVAGPEPRAAADQRPLAELDGPVELGGSGVGARHTLGGGTLTASTNA